MSNKRAIISVVLVLVAVNLGMGIKWFLAARSAKASNACGNNLRQIVGGKDQWALENHKSTNDVPSWNELNAYLSHKPVCAQGGTYNLGRVGELPTCSVGGPGHTLPAN
jgi:hypothetical protein